MNMNSILRELIASCDVYDSHDEGMDIQGVKLPEELVKFLKTKIENFDETIYTSIFIHNNFIDTSYIEVYQHDEKTWEEINSYKFDLGLAIGDLV